MRQLAWLAISASLALASPHAAKAADMPPLRVGTPAILNFTFLPLQVGQQKGFF